MRIFTLLSLVLLLPALSACQINQVKGEVEDVEIEATRKGSDSEDHHHGEGEFCPPGQAKKGRC